MNPSRTLIDVPNALTLATVVGSGVVGGVFFAFSSFVMKALDRLPSAQGIAAMQAINVAAPTPLFMGVLFGTALTSTALGISALFRLDETAARYQLVGSVLYLGAVAITAAYHVPRNDALALIDPSSPAAESFWNSYLSGWTTWNHVRTLAAVAGASVLAVGLRVG